MILMKYPILDKKRALGEWLISKIAKWKYEFAQAQTSNSSIFCHMENYILAVLSHMEFIPAIGLQSASDQIELFLFIHLKNISMRFNWYLPPHPTFLTVEREKKT